MHTTVIIVPCFNEEKRLRLEEFSRSVGKYAWLHFVFVNDGSTDATPTLLKALAAEHERQIHYLELPGNVGKAQAVWHGFHHAFAMAPEYIGYWDADLATPLSALEEMQAQLSTPGTVMVFGSRVRLLHRRIERRALRHYLGRIYATVASLVLGLTIYDTQCGAKIFRDTPNLRRVFGEPFLTGWIFDVEIFARFNLLHKYAGAPSLTRTAIEHPLQEWHDISGSKIRIWDFFQAPYELILIGFYLHGPRGRRHALKH